MDEEARKSLEYEEQFFGLSSLFFGISFKNFVTEELEEKVEVLVKSFRAKLINQAADPDRFEKALEKMKTDLKNEYLKSLENVYQEILSKISNAMHIPQNVLLNEDLPVKLGVNGNLNTLKEEVRTLEETFKSLLYLKQEVTNELNVADSAIFLAESVFSDEKFDFNVLPVREIVTLSKQNNLSLNSVS